MTLPLDRFENVHQLAGITTATLDDGPQRGSRVAMVNTGSALRYTIALDRGADLVHATANQHSLAYLTQNGIKPPGQEYNREDDWQYSWPAGLMTTCGPVHIGHARDHDGVRTSLHGRHSNLPATVNAVIQPDPWAGRMEMGVDATIADTRGFGPNVVVERSIRSTIGSDSITLTDKTTNRDPRPNPFGLMYHVNCGWPLMDAGSKLVLSGKFDPWLEPMQEAPLPKSLEGWKDVPAPSKDFLAGSRGGIITPNTDRDGIAHVGMINPKLNIALELCFKVRQIPRVMIWQNYCPGMYVCGIEPLIGSPFDKAQEPQHHKTLKPGQSRKTELTLNVLTDAKAIAKLARHDGKLTLMK
jgi:hypothetical protein